MSNNDLGTIMRDSCAIAPHANAIELDGRWFDWAFIAQTIELIESILSLRDVPPGAEIALLCRNRPHQVAAFCAVICTGRCITPINPFGASEKVISDLNDLNATVLIASGADWEIPGLGEFVQKNEILGVELDESLSKGHVRVRNPELNLEPSRFSNIRPGTAVLIQSSGTTGKPKRIPIGAANLTSAYSKIPSGVIGEGRAVKEKPALITQPLVHIGGLFWIVHSLLEARPISLIEKFDVEKWTNAIERYGIRVCSLVPAMINMVLESGIDPKRIESLICVRSGTAPLSQEAQRNFEERFGIPILPTYGATEFAGAVCGWTLPLKKEYGEKKAGSVGRAYEGVELRVVDQDTGENLSAGQTGILQIKSSGMLGSDEWVSTTDLADIDDEDFLWLRGRADSAINRGGFKIIPSEVSDILEKNEKIKEAVVFGVEDARLGQVPVAVVELEEGVSDIDESELKKWAKAHMTSYFVPVEIKIVKELPRTPSMKVSEVEVKRLFTRD